MGIDSQNDRSIVCYRKALAIEQQISRQTRNVSSAANLARYADAEPFARQVLAYSQRTKAPNHPDIATELINLVFIQRHLTKYREAEQSLRKALAIHAGWYPAGHSDIADVKRILADVLLEEGRYHEAMPHER